MIKQTELEELLREHGLAPYVYIKSEKIGDIYSAEWLIKHYDEWCDSFTGMDNYREHKREMIDLLKTHPQPLRIYSQFEDMMGEIPGGLELVNRLGN